MNTKKLNAERMRKIQDRLDQSAAKLHAENPDFQHNAYHDLRWCLQSLASRDREITELRASLNHARQWWGSRSKRLQDFARAELPEPLKDKFFSIVANGKADVHEEPTYERQLVMLEHERDKLAEQLKAALSACRSARSAIDRLMGDSDLPDDDSYEMATMQQLNQVLDTAAQQAEKGANE